MLKMKAIFKFDDRIEFIAEQIKLYILQKYGNHSKLIAVHIRRGITILKLLICRIEKVDRFLKLIVTFINSIHSFNI